MHETTTDAKQEPTLSAEGGTPLETLSAISQCLLQWEDGSVAAGTMDVAAGGFLGIASAAKDAGGADVARLCELGDQLLEALRSGALSASSPIIDALLEMCDTLASVVGASGADDGLHTPDLAPLHATLERLLQGPRAADPPAPPAPPAWPAPGAGLPPELVAEFKADSLEGLQMLEAVLLAFERNPRDVDCLHAVFRVIHTIKGAADYVGLRQIKTLSHRLEDVLDLARAGRCEITDSISDLVFRSVDELKGMIAGLEPDGEPDRDLAALVSELEATKQAPAPQRPAETRSATISAEELAVYASSAEQQLESIAACCAKLAEGDASEAVLSVIHRGVTTLLAAAGCLQQASVAAPAQELLDAIEALCRERGQICEKLAALQARRLPDHRPGETADPPGDGVVACCEAVAQGDSSEAVLAALIRDLAGLRQAAAQSGPVELADAAATFAQEIEEIRQSRDQHRQRLRTLCGENAAAVDLRPEQRAIEPAAVPAQSETRPADGRSGASAGAPTGAAAGKTMRVDQGKLEDYINLAGELVIARNALVHDFGQLRIDGAHRRRLKESVDRLQRIVADIQANAMSMRMAPVMNVFQRFPRMVRDIAKTQGKQIEIQLFGEDTELDKQVAEKLGDPLVHLIRNSADHGIESPEERRAAGKSESGLITLKAAREGSAILIEIADDGRGIDVARLKAKAVEKGILSQAQADALSRENALQLIFAAGLSTAKTVSDISGRGVGMDVVRNNIAQVGGCVSVLSQQGQGTTIRLQLPLTLAVTNVVLVSSQGLLYALPMESVKETVKIAPHDLRTLNGRNAISLRGKVIPVVSLSEVLSARGRARGDRRDQTARLARDRSGRVPIVVVAVASACYGIAVDELMGQQEIVIKPLPSQLGQLPGVAGATIMGDGSVVLILDTASLYGLAARRADPHAPEAPSRTRLAAPSKPRA